MGGARLELASARCASRSPAPGSSSWATLSSASTFTPDRGADNDFVQAPPTAVGQQGMNNIETCYAVARSFSTIRNFSTAAAARQWGLDVFGLAFDVHSSTGAVVWVWEQR